MNFLGLIQVRLSKSSILRKSVIFFFLRPKATREAGENNSGRA
jgi:hypothetical protein